MDRDCFSRVGEDVEAAAARDTSDNRLGEGLRISGRSWTATRAFLADSWPDSAVALEAVILFACSAEDVALGVAVLVGANVLPLKFGIRFVTLSNNSNGSDNTLPSSSSVLGARYECDCH